MSIDDDQMSAEQRTKRTLVFISVLFAIFMIAVNVTIVATAMPSIVGELGGFALFSWVFSIYLLTQAVSVPIYGKLADLFGRKPVIIFGIVLFIIGSILCGLADSMMALIIYRLIQGIGAGAVLPIATTIVGDIYSKEERAKVQGYLSSVWGISAVSGPLLGGFFVEYVHWSWVFWINLPLGVISIVGILFFLHEDIEKKIHAIDYAGSVLLLVSISAFMLLLIQGGVAWAWMSVPSFILAAVFVLGLLLFVLQEARAADPLMPLSIWQNRLIATANIASITTGAILFGVSSFLPTYIQGVLDQSPTVAGLTLAAMSIGWLLAATLSGKMMIKIGFRFPAMLGGLALIIGALFFLNLDAQQGPFWAGVGALFIGLGMGFTTTTFIVAIQSRVEWKIRGVVTSSNMFMRMMGGTIGVALMGGILNSRMARYLEEHGQNEHAADVVDLDFTNILLDLSNRGQYSKGLLQLLRDGLALSLQSVYIVILLMAILSLVIVFFLPKDQKL